MSIANLCVLRGYSNEQGEFQWRLRNALSGKELPDAGGVCGQLGEGRELWKRRCAWKSRRSGGISTFPQLQQQQCLLWGGSHEVKRRMMPCAKKWGRLEARLFWRS